MSIAKYQYCFVLCDTYIAKSDLYCANIEFLYKYIVFFFSLCEFDINYENKYYIGIKVKYKFINEREIEK